MGKKSKDKAKAEQEPAPELVEKVAPEEAEPALAAPEEAPAPTYKVAEGRSVSTGNMIIGEGKPIKPADLCKNETAATSNFDRLVSIGLIVEA